MIRQRCHRNCQSWQRMVSIPLVADLYTSPYLITKLSKLKYVEILGFALITTYFLMGISDKSALPIIGMPTTL